ncbi:MAG: enoyl-CoA hydratase/isomerase family protein [Alphaproteobacteria bacterium]|tara:strand:+ start:431 stop:1267 length:837 start_codon:yes stop_codon:yes gene_type:complete
MADKWIVNKEWPDLILERLEDAGVARITLNRPEKRNALNEALVEAFFESLEIIRADRDIKAVVTRGAGKVYSAGLDLHFLRDVSNEGLLDWDRPTPTIQLAEALRGFPRIMIAQVHGYCLGGALGIMNCHDLVFAANDAQFGMPEILRGSFGQLVTSTLIHGSIPMKKVTLMQLVGKNISGEEADRWGVISQSMPLAELEDTVTEIARDLGSRHLAPLEHSKITVQMGRDLSMSQAIELDQLVGQRLRRAMDPLGDVESYLESQKGGPNLKYKRPDVK